jgi:hypothetical protein
MKISLSLASALFLFPLLFTQSRIDNRTLRCTSVYSNEPAAYFRYINTETLQNKPHILSESGQNDFHKYYLSVSNVTYNSKVKALQMTTRFFVDDLENVLSDRTGKRIIFNKDADLNNQKTTIATYIEKKLEVSTDGSMRSIIYIGGEIENDQVIFYTEIPVPQEPSNISMKFTAFQELFEDQKNMVHLKIKGKRGTLLMTKDKQTDFLKLT